MNGYKDKFNKIVSQFNEGKFEIALFSIDQILFEPELSNKEKLKAKYLKSSILIQQGNLKEAYDISKELFKDSRALNERLIAMDALLNQYDAVCRLNQLEQANELKPHIGNQLKSLEQFNVDESLIQKRKARFLRLQGDQAFATSEYDAALSEYKKSLKLSNDLQNDKMTAWALNNIGNVYYYQNKLDKSLKYYKRSLEIRKKLDLQLDTIKSLGNVRIVYFAKGDFDKALESYKHGLQLLEDDDKNDIKARYLNIISLALQEKGSLAEAYQYAKKSLEIQKSLDNTKEIANTLHSLATIEHQRGNLNEALEYTKKSLKLKNKLGDKKEIALSHDSLGEIYLTKGEINKALDNFELAMYLKEKIGFELGIGRSLLYIADIYIHLSDFFTAEESLKKALGLATDDYQLKALIYHKLVKTHILSNSPSGLLLAKTYLKKLKKIKQHHDDLRIEFCYAVSKARYLNKTKEHIKAKNSLFTIINIDQADHKLFLEALQLQIAVLFNIYRKSTDIGDLETLKQFITRTQTIAKDYHNYALLTKINLIKAKLMLFEEKSQEALNLFDTTQDLAKDKGLVRFGNILEKKMRLITKKMHTNEFNKVDIDVEEQLLRIEQYLSQFGFL